MQIVDHGSFQIRGRFTGCVTDSFRLIRFMMYGYMFICLIHNFFTLLCNIVARGWLFVKWTADDGGVKCETCY